MSDTKIQPRVGLHRSTKLIGMKFENPQGDALGKIEDLVIDPGEGRIAAVVVSFGGFLGLGEKLVAIPISAFTYDEVKRRFLLNIDKETLRNAPSFGTDDWPELIDRVWAADVFSYYGYPPYWH
jgi:sporulation protein YlmC with PRC-barrel domain